MWWRCRVHQGLPAAFAALFGARIDKHIFVPPETFLAHDLWHERHGAEDFFPEILDSLIAELGELRRGRLVIVGAGYAGKCIVHEARARGAVALDLGSILDYWVGAASRSYLSASLRSPEPLRVE